MTRTNARNTGICLILLSGILYLPQPIPAVFIMTVGSWLVVFTTKWYVRIIMIPVSLFYSFVSVWFVLGLLLR